MKEYIATTNGGNEVDEACGPGRKKMEESCYNIFSTTKGVSFGIGGNIGAQVMNLAVAGGTLGISGSHNKSKFKTKGT